MAFAAPWSWRRGAEQSPQKSARLLPAFDLLDVL